MLADSSTAKDVQRGDGGVRLEGEATNIHERSVQASDKEHEGGIFAKALCTL